MKVLEARLTRDTELFDKMDPYCVLNYKGKKIQTRVHEGGGKTPKWNEEFTIMLEDNGGELQVIIMDSDMVTDDTVGGICIGMRHLVATEPVKEWYELQYKNKSAGKVLLETVFIPSMPSQP